MINENKFTSPSSTLKQALKQMSKFGLKCLIIIDENKFIGTLSDGDIRRALLSSSDIDSKIDNILGNITKNLVIIFPIPVIKPNISFVPLNKLAINIIEDK